MILITRCMFIYGRWELVVLDLLMVHFVSLHGTSDVEYEAPKPLDTNHPSRLQRCSVQRIGYET